MYRAGLALKYIAYLFDVLVNGWLIRSAFGTEQALIKAYSN